MVEVGKNTSKQQTPETRRQQAHDLVDALFAEAREERSHGRLGLEISFQDGVPQSIRKLENVVYK